MNKTRIKKLNNIKIANEIKGNVVYWMHRDHRILDNNTLIASLKTAKKHNVKVEIIFSLRKSFLKSMAVYKDLMLKGLEEVKVLAAKNNIKFTLISNLENQEKMVVDYLKINKSSFLFTDFTPLKTNRKWVKNVIKNVNIPAYEVDSRNIIPVWLTSEKEEFAAYTIRPKIYNKLSEYLDKFDNSNLVNIKYSKESPQNKALITLQNFIKNKLIHYADKRNSINKNLQSNLSKYLHFGHISSQTTVLEVLKQTKISKDIFINIKTNKAKIIKENEVTLQESAFAFIEELVVRRELAENYCYYNKNYDNPKGYHEWAKKTHLEHKNDRRQYNYSLEKLEQYKTHDDVWNKATKEMIKTGKMHGYLRMYWAKKVLEWTPSVKIAHKYLIYLNDKYMLDGRDPNGYTGIAWSVGGVHDRAWFERDIFGKIRYMNYEGLKRKFDLKKYLS